MSEQEVSSQNLPVNPIVHAPGTPLPPELLEKVHEPVASKTVEELSKEYGIPIVDLGVTPAAEVEPTELRRLAGDLGGKTMSPQEVDEKLAQMAEQLTVDPVALSLRPKLDDVILPDLESLLKTAQVEFQAQQQTSFKTICDAVVKRVQSLLARQRSYLAKLMREMRRDLVAEEGAAILCSLDGTVDQKVDGTLLDDAAKAIDDYVAAEWDKMSDVDNIITIADDKQLRKFAAQHGLSIQLSTTPHCKDVDDLRKLNPDLKHTTLTLLQESLQRLLKNLNDRNALVVISTPRAHMRREAYMLQAYVYCRFLILKDHTVCDSTTPPVPPFDKTQAMSVPLATMPLRMNSNQASKAQKV